LTVTILSCSHGPVGRFCIFEIFTCQSNGPQGRGYRKERT